MVDSIDLSPFYTDNIPEQHVQAEKLSEICQLHGFFKIINHPFTKERLDQLISLSHDFFTELEDEEKKELMPKMWNSHSKNEYRGFFPSKVNGKEGLDMGNFFFDGNSGDDQQFKEYFEKNLLPKGSKWEEWVEFMREYYADMLELGKVIMRVFALSLDVEMDYFERHFDHESTISTLRLNYYPFTENFKSDNIADDGTVLGCEIHKDSVAVTILYQPSVGGLQIESQGEWIEVDPEPYDFVVNTGMLMERWTNGFYHAANHRVRASTEERISVPFFMEPSVHSIIEPFFFIFF